MEGGNTQEAESWKKITTKMEIALNPSSEDTRTLSSGRKSVTGM